MYSHILRQSYGTHGRNIVGPPASYNGYEGYPWTALRGLSEHRDLPDGRTGITLWSQRNVDRSDTAGAVDNRYWSLALWMAKGLVSKKN